MQVLETPDLTDGFLHVTVLETSASTDGFLPVTAAGTGDHRSNRWALTCESCRCWRHQTQQMGSNLWQLQVLETSDLTDGFLPVTDTGTRDLRSNRWDLTCDSCRCWRHQTQEMGSYLWQLQVLETSDPTDGLLLRLPRPARFTFHRCSISSGLRKNPVDCRW